MEVPDEGTEDVKLSPSEFQLEWNSSLYKIETAEEDDDDDRSIWLPDVASNFCEPHDIEKPPCAQKVKKKKVKAGNASDETKLEDNAQEVRDRFERGCECQDETCFRGLNAENVYKHRLNIAELTKAEHDMYLMGVTMASLANPDTTIRQKERQRLRAHYVYQGRRVCLDAFLYLENCTHYQVKRIRKHVMTHGVAPRVHGNHGKKPHNTFSLDIYKHATEFIKQYMEQFVSEQLPGKVHVQLPSEITRKNMHDAYKEYGKVHDRGMKLMGYSTFRYFMKEQFPHVRFSKIEPKPTHSVATETTCTITMPIKNETATLSNCIVGNKVQQVIPLMVAPNDGSAQTFIVAPVIANANSSTLTYLPNTTTSYVINKQGSLVAQPTKLFTFDHRV